MAGIQDTINKGIGIVAGAVAIPQKLDMQAKKQENKNIQLMEIANKRAQDLKIAKARQKKLLKEHFYGYLEDSNKDTDIANKITIAEMSLGKKKEHSPENILKEIYKNEKKIGGDLYGK